jgi:ectoine hydroxylase-related dioxygenase (phytanoyl-CoA dioxygenase family)
MTNLQKLDQDGVVLLKGILPDEPLAKVRSEYDQLDQTLTRTDIAKDRPLIVFWRHVVGEQKRIGHFDEFPALWNLITDHIVPALRREFPQRAQYLQLLETIIFNKPPEISNTLHWHQDVAYFPLKPNNQIAIWIPFEMVTAERGAMNYAVGSHKKGIRGSTNLHTREKFANEDRDLIPEDPRAAGFEVRCMEMTPNDMLVHDGYTWHYSGPNVIKGYTRRGLSVRFMTQEAAFDPRPGQGAAFTKQIDIQPGEILRGTPFPTL